MNSMRFSGSINKGKLRAITSGKAARRGRTVIAQTLWAWSASGKKGHGKKKILTRNFIFPQKLQQKANLDLW